MKVTFYNSQTSTTPIAVLSLTENDWNEELDWIADCLGAHHFEIDYELNF